MTLLTPPHPVLENSIFLIASLRILMEHLLKLVFQVRTLAEDRKIREVQAGVTAVHKRFGENRVNLPGFDEDRGEHEGGAEAAEELEEAAGGAAQPGVEEEHPGHLAHDRAPEQEW